MEEETKKDNGTGDKPREVDDIDRANTAAKRMEDATKARDEQLRREERLEVSRRLGGNTEAGQPQVEPETETDKQYAEDVVAGKHND